MRIIQIRRIFITYFIVVFIIINIILFSISETYAIIYWPKDNGNIQCYSDMMNEVLQSVEDLNFLPKSKSIFFHDTSCRGGIDSRQACAVESAARAHPDWDVYLLFNAPVTHVMLKRSCLAKLLQYSNIKLARIHALSFSNNTIVSQIVSQRLQNRLKGVQLMATIMKILTVKKWGGVILDLDVLVLKAFIDDLPRNWIAKETSDVFSRVMRISKDVAGQNFTRDVLREIARFGRNPYFNGDLAIERAVVKRCTGVLRTNRNCQGIKVIDPGLFYPKVRSLVKNSSQPLDQTPYTLFKRKMSTNTGIIPPNSVYVKMAKMVCPKIYQMFGDEFGV